ncbi:hypothetical protein MasN3_44220 [Massilia varians]|uniref:Integrase n=1 Tax=Massilia varians TaxID=457921 RepID=A0ABN6TFC1_9BURK|nr:hypothetical protein MasN3_44220 [Massilia varians]
MATIVKTPSGTWKAVIRKAGWPTTVKTFRLKKDAEDWSRRTEDEMVRGLFIKRSPSERMTFEAAMKRYLAEVTPTKRPLGCRIAASWRRMSFSPRAFTVAGARNRKYKPLPMLAKV